jgi:surface protein
MNKTKKMRLMVTDDLQALHQQWLHHDDGAMVVYALSFLDVKHLLQKERVNKTWRKLCTRTIQGKCGPNGPQTFQSKQELKDAIKRYCKYDAVTIEELACTYGYPIDRWNVSQVEDMSWLFSRMHTFNEPIGSWDVSSVTDMGDMFYDASHFNQDIGAWQVSSVKIMSCMFENAMDFNQDIGP